jgi:hypothetical protein
MSFVKKATPPPAVEEGDMLKAKIVDIKKVQSQWKDEEGNLREQLEFDLALEDGYKVKTWMAYYEQPSERSKLGKLALKLAEVTKKDPKNIQEFLDLLKNYGWIFVKVKGFREFEEELYPNFTIVVDKLPQAKVETKEPVPQTQSKQPTLEVQTKQFDAKQLLAPFEDAVKLGLPFNETDFTRAFLVEQRIFLFKNGYIEKRLDLYYPTNKAYSLFQ